MSIYEKLSVTFAVCSIAITIIHAIVSIYRSRFKVKIEVSRISNYKVKAASKCLYLNIKLISKFNKNFAIKNIYLKTFGKSSQFIETINNDKFKNLNVDSFRIIDIDLKFFYGLEITNQNKFKLIIQTSRKKLTKTIKLSRYL